MANQEEDLLINLNTNYADVVVDIGKILVGESCRKKMNENQNQKRQQRHLSIAVCALLNSGGGIVRMESEDRNYCFQEHGIGLDIENSLRDCIGSNEIGEYFTWMQEGSNLLLFVKTWSCGGLEQGSAEATKPRLCSLSTGLFYRSSTSVFPVKSRDTPEFLRGKKSSAKCDNVGGLSAKRALPSCSDGANETSPNIQKPNFQDAAARFLKRDKVLVGEVLDFTETTHIEFKQYSTENILKYMSENLPNYVSAFANTEGGYLFFGVDDNGKVTGTPSNVEKEALEQAVAETISSMSVYHSCGSEALGVQFQTHILDVYDQAECSQGYICAVHTERSCCPVFHGDPESWMVMGGKIERLRAGKWMELMTAADPVVSALADEFKTELSLANGPPLIKPVYSKAGLQCAAELQEHLYPVGSNEIKWKPETICTDLFSEYPGLEDLMRKQLRGVTQGVLIFSRSWAVDIGLQKNQDVVCDALLVADSEYPVLFTVVRDTSCVTSGTWRETARALKQKLVNDGGYTSRVCVIPQILLLNGTEDQTAVKENDFSRQETLHDSTSPYPKSYILTSRDIPAFLQALVIVVLGFKSYLSDHLGCEIFSLLTLKQYELLSKNLHKVRKLFILGLPGTGKTVVALKIIEKIKNTFHCSADEILYICENQPLRDFVRNRNCQAVTRAAFLKKNFPDVKHIVVDEAQNFRHDEGDWYQRTRSIVERSGGIFWVFVDFFQTTYPYDCGLVFSEMDPQEWLTKMVRNAKEIWCFMLNLMRKIHQARNIAMPYEVLGEFLKQAECAHSLPGSFREQYIRSDELANYVAELCKSYLDQGYSLGDMAILCSRQREADQFRQELQPELARQLSKSRVRGALGLAEDVSKDVIVLDSIRRFSGLERTIVFVINPYTPIEHIFDNLVLCAVSRANTKVHLFYQ
ncbi:PREDICTED: schlafen family member 13-like [Lepidothrix coronata]|uniref:Schlafen family member 13-like n=1 Tax=Lepidothrix coronata TaxID=321398 RepID=A0A6J0J6S7_9PASS|nr:PREDICTED: schlafen family member 13-like [Lepidothrix coronata]